jgi:nucleotide-binding universal stress UspA family protein
MTMILFKKILVPTDFSDPSYEAMRTANEMALHFGAELYIVHVVPLVPVTPATIDPAAFNVPLYQEGLQVSYRKLLDETVEEIISKKLSVRSMILQGDAAPEIVQLAGDENIDLIVISTHGETGLGRLIFGSVAEKVVRLAPCPVLTTRIPQEAE